jgi:uncharacterized Fe-S cluster protein YjdI
MRNAVQEYPGRAITVRFDPRACIHSGNCVRTLPAVFDIKKRPWVKVEGADAGAIVATIKACPSGALTYQIA